MDLLAYFRVLRRRWTLILAFVVVGGTLGAASTLLSDATGSSSKHYKATHTLLFEASSDSSSTGSSSSSSSSGGSAGRAFSNLDQIAILVTTGDVPNQVAKKLGMEPHQVTERITTETNSFSGTLAITGIEADAKSAERLTDAVAQQTIDTLNQKEQTRFDKLSRDTISRLDKLRSDIARLDGQVSGPFASDVARAERDGLVDQYRLAFERFQQLAAQGAPTGALSTLETASAVPISVGTYDTLRDRAQLGENNQRADTQQNQDQTNGSSSSSSSPSFDSPTARGVLGAFLGLLLGVGLALIAERMDRRLRTRDDVAAAFDLPVLAEVPRFTTKQRREKVIVLHTDPISRAAEGYRAVRSSLLFQNAHLDGSATGDGGAGGNGAGAAMSGATRHDSLVVMVASAVPGDGKTTTSVNIAAAFAETGASVLLVNCDFRRPMVHEYLGSADLPRRTLETVVPNVWLVSGAVSQAEANPPQVIAAQRHVIASAREHFDVIVLDTAPLLTANDAVEIVSSADLVLLVARFQATTTDHAQRAMELLNRVEAPVAGVVVVGTPEDSGAYYYYQQYRGRGRSEASRPRTEPESVDQGVIAHNADAFEAHDGRGAGAGREPGSSG
jgi:Mrp family chromosome partitioning ATPase/capsular polysaccharide biosynthesis protein